MGKNKGGKKAAEAPVEAPSVEHIAPDPFQQEAERRLRVEAIERRMAAQNNRGTGVVRPTSAKPPAVEPVLPPRATSEIVSPTYVDDDVALAQRLQEEVSPIVGPADSPSAAPQVAVDTVLPPPMEASDPRPKNAMTEAIERRMAAQSNRGTGVVVARPTSAKPPPAMLLRAATEFVPTVEPPLATSEIAEVPAPVPPPSDPRREAMAAAAMRRQTAALGGMSAEAAGALDQDREKSDLLVRIRGQLATLRDDEPFGLRSMDGVKLRMFSKHLAERIAAKK